MEKKNYTGKDIDYLHQLLDYLIDSNETSGILELANMDDDLNIHQTTYRMYIKIDN